MHRALRLYDRLVLMLQYTGRGHRKLSKGLQLLHSHGVIQTDTKQSNFLLDVSLSPAFRCAENEAVRTYIS